MYLSSKQCLYTFISDTKADSSRLKGKSVYGSRYKLIYKVRCVTKTLLLVVLFYNLSLIVDLFETAYNVLHNSELQLQRDPNNIANIKM